MLQDDKSTTLVALVTATNSPFQTLSSLNLICSYTQEHPKNVIEDIGIVFCLDLFRIKSAFGGFFFLRADSQCVKYSAKKRS